MPHRPSTISSQSRKKLQTFRFQSESRAHEDKENADTASMMQGAPNDPSEKTTRAALQPLSQAEPSACPQTPGKRIPFSDLIANPEDALSRHINATPLEQVQWKSGPGSSQPSGSATSTQRRVKRARSSSPTLNLQTERSRHFASDKDPLDLEVIGRSLRTPKHEDPLSLLWTNYVGPQIPETHYEPVLPPLAPMSSSPITPGALKKDNLRRTASCGIEWPVSSGKKRKLSEVDPYRKAKGIFAAKKDAILAKSATNQSRVSVLVDSIHQSLLKKAVSEADIPSSSSPLPERHAEFLRSSLKEIVALKPILEQKEDAYADEQDWEMDHHIDKSSEFGDMDIDLDDPDLLVAVQAATQRRASPSHKSNTSQRQPSNRTVTAPTTMSNEADKDRQKDTSLTVKQDLIQADPSTRPGAERAPKLNDHISEVDSFDDFDDEDDAFATELAELVDQVDSQNIANLDGAYDSTKLQRSLTPLTMQAAKDEFDDEFDDCNDINDIWSAVDNANLRATKDHVGPENKVTQDNRTIKRYLVHDIFEKTFKNHKGRQQPEKVVSIKDEKLQHIYTVCLRDSWFDTRCTKDSYVHLIGDFDRYGNCIVSDEANMVVLHPDHLISATTVADSFSCERRATLQDRVKATSLAEAPQVYGHLIHEVFGEALRQNKWDLHSLREIVEKLVPSYIESLYEINVQTHDAVEYVMSKMPELSGWAGVFVTAKLDHKATIRDRNGSVVPMAIDKLLELEEHVWSPMYGLKGNIDATVQIQMQAPDDRSSRTLTVPFELKTGKRDTNTMHRAQTALYTLLLSDRYDINVTSGILYYLETSKTFRVEGVRNEIRDMIIQRNKLACYVHDKLDLPPMVKREQLCKKCFAQTACFTYHKLMENGDGETSGMKDVFTDVVGHLKEPQQKFFEKWDNLLTKEERDAMKFKRELWTMLSTERESLGRCFSSVIIEPGSAGENSKAPKINRYTYSFVKHKHKPGFSFAESQITVGEPIVISDEKGHFALANGFVTNVRPIRITVAVDRRLQNTRVKQHGFDTENNQVFSAIMDVKHSDPESTSLTANLEIPMLYRIDKDEFQNGMAVARNNVLRIMEKDLWRARELRQLIVDHKPPVFKQITTAYTLSGPASQQDLNIDQRRAIEKVMSAKDYALVLGMPGTGKTTTIAHIIRALVSQGKSVLLTSYTHTAVDNILLKIKDDNIPILRLGAVGKVHPDVASFADLSGIPKNSVAELEASWTKSKVVATTCLGINHAIFNHRKFDYCIVDEASQITLPVCLGPIRLASTFILVGDHYQLPPLVQNKEAQEGGLDVSLFKLLSDAQPASVVNLEHQYRMAEDIMVLSNVLIYGGRLKCGTPSVASRILRIPNLNAGMEAHHHTPSTLAHRSQATQACVQNSGSCWLASTLDPLRRTIFLNTDTISHTSPLGAPETVTGHGTRITNVIEASIVAQLLTTLIRSGVPPKSIGVITFYRSQLALLRSTVKSLAGTSAANDLEMHTADKYQGRDKEVIILSCVRSNEACHVGELLKDWRRVNVALTRARSKLMIIGSLTTLGACGVPVLEGLSRILKKKKWVLDLPENALELHHFEGMSSQTQPQSHSKQISKLRGGSMEHRGLGNDNISRAMSVQRMPLSSVKVNVNTKRSLKQPTKVVKGGVSIDKFLDQHPLIKDLMRENVIEISDEEPWDDEY